MWFRLVRPRANRSTCSEFLGASHLENACEQLVSLKARLGYVHQLPDPYHHPRRRFRPGEGILWLPLQPDLPAPHDVAFYAGYHAPYDRRECPRLRSGIDQVVLVAMWEGEGFRFYTAAATSSGINSRASTEPNLRPSFPFCCKIGAWKQRRVPSHLGCAPTLCCSPPL